jgi:hypothetical protein
MTLDAFIQRESSDNAPSPVLQASKRRIRRPRIDACDTPPLHSGSAAAITRGAVDMAASRGRTESSDAGSRPRTDSSDADGTASRWRTMVAAAVDDDDHAAVVDDLDCLDLGDAAHLSRPSTARGSVDGDDDELIRVPGSASTSFVAAPRHGGFASHSSSSIGTSIEAYAPGASSASSATGDGGGGGGGGVLHRTTSAALPRGASAILPRTTSAASGVSDSRTAGFGLGGMGSGRSLDVGGSGDSGGVGGGGGGDVVSPSSSPTMQMRRGGSGSGGATASPWFFQRASSWKNLDEVLWYRQEPAASKHSTASHLRCAELRGHRSGASITCMDAVGDR